MLLKTLCNLKFINYYSWSFPCFYVQILVDCGSTELMDSKTMHRGGTTVVIEIVAETFPNLTQVHRHEHPRKHTQQLKISQNRKALSQMASLLSWTKYLKLNWYQPLSKFSKNLKRGEQSLTHSVRPALPWNQNQTKILTKKWTPEANIPNEQCCKNCE